MYSTLWVTILKYTIAELNIQHCAVSIFARKGDSRGKLREADKKEKEFGFYHVTTKREIL